MQDDNPYQPTEFSSATPPRMLQDGLVWHMFRTWATIFSVLLMTLICIIMLFVNLRLLATIWAAVSLAALPWLSTSSVRKKWVFSCTAPPSVLAVYLGGWLYFWLDRYTPLQNYFQKQPGMQYWIPAATAFIVAMVVQSCIEIRLDRRSANSLSEESDGDEN